MRVACVGEAMIELSMNDSAAQVGVAGDTLNTAIYMHRAAPDLAVDYVTRLGDDPFSDRIAAFIAQQGIGCDAIARGKGQSPGLYAITVAEDGERSFTYWRDSAAARDLFAGDDFAVLEGYDVIYLSGISLAILPQAVRRALVDWLQTSKATVVYDSNYRPRLWDSVDHARSITRAMWARADIALPSIDDEMALFDETAQQVENRFAGFQGRGALKRGAAGPMSIGSDVRQSYSPAPSVIDSTAAGDSFNGAYLASVLSGADQATALMAGHCMAARVVGHRGAIIP